MKNVATSQQSSPFMKLASMNPCTKRKMMKADSLPSVSAVYLSASRVFDPGSKSTKKRAIEKRMFQNNLNQNLDGFGFHLIA